MSCVLFIAGGSGGHLMPVIAVLEALRELRPDVEMHVLCTDRPEDREALRQRNISFSIMPTLRVRWSLPLHLARSVLFASRVLRELHPSVIFSKGGASGLPLCFLAHRRGIPVILHESDAVMGRANRWGARWAETVCMGFPSLNPVRPEILRGNRAEGLHLTGFSGKRPILLVQGGSQGAVALNDVVCAAIDPLLTLCDVIHLTGRGKEGCAPRPGYWSRPFVDAELPHLLACTDVALSRAGASTIAELAAHGIPAILVPLRGLAQDHQLANARAAEQTGGCAILQQELLQEKFIPILRQFLAEPGRRHRMKEGMESIANTSAARRVAEIVAKYLASPREAA